MVVTWYDNPDTPISNANNTLEATNRDLKTKLRVHNGMSKRYRKLFQGQMEMINGAICPVYVLFLTNK